MAVMIAAGLMSDERRPDHTSATVAHGTAPHDAPVPRTDFERAVRALNTSDLDVRDLVVRLAAQVVALTEELDRRLPEGSTTVSQSVGAALPEVLDRIQGQDARDRGRVWLESKLDNKYEVEGESPPCEELMPICQARCCRLSFPLSTQDLDEGIIRWDYGRPYRIRQRASDGYCVHNEPGTGHCTVHTHRPSICRRYHCRNDSQIWLDYDKRIPAPLGTSRGDTGAPFDLTERVRERAAALFRENSAVENSFPEEAPGTGVVPPPRPPRR